MKGNLVTWILGNTPWNQYSHCHAYCNSFVDLERNVIFPQTTGARDHVSCHTTVSAAGHSWTLPSDGASTARQHHCFGSGLIQTRVWLRDHWVTVRFISRKLNFWWQRQRPPSGSGTKSEWSNPDSVLGKCDRVKKWIFKVRFSFKCDARCPTPRPLWSPVQGVVVRRWGGIDVDGFHNITGLAFRSGMAVGRVLRISSLYKDLFCGWRLRATCYDDLVTTQVLSSLCSMM